MRNLSISSQDFDQELQEEFYGKLGNILFLASGNKAYIPTQKLNLETLERTKLLLPFNKPEKLRDLAILSWYHPNEYMGRFIRDSIKRELAKSTIDFKVRGKVFPLLETKELMLTFLVDCDESISARDWYGNIKKELTAAWDSLKLLERGFVKLPKVEKYTGYCRGYRSSPKQEKKVHQQAIENNLFIESWEYLKKQRDRLHQVNETATQLYIMRDYDNYNLIKEELSYLNSSYTYLKLNLGLTESQIDNIIEAEELHKSEGVKKYNY